MKAIELAQLPPDCRRALVRWKRGHHAFHVQLVAINTVLADGEKALAAGDQPVLLRALRRLCILYDAATASMRYAADFPPHLYESVIRPSMMPPFLSPGFSGMFNTEHKVMMAALSRFSRALANRWGEQGGHWPPELEGAWKALEAAQERNRKSHGLICRKFVRGGESLLRKFYAQEAKQRGRAMEDKVLTASR